MDTSKSSGADAAHQREMRECLASAIELHRAGHLAQAEALYRALLNVKPDHADALHLLGVMATQLGQFDNAAALIERAIGQQPGSGEFHLNHGIALQNAGRLPDAIDAYRQAAVLVPNDPRVAENLAVALTDTGDREGAIAACGRALELNPGSAIAHKNLGTLLNNAGDSPGARHHFEQVLAQFPALPDAHEKLATVLLRQHHYARGFDEYEWRTANTAFLTAHPPVFAAYPTWTGDDLAGRTLLITPEQGIGDEILFASCLGDVIERAGQVVIACEPRLQPLLARSFVDALVIGDAPLPSGVDVDCTISCASLPRYLRRDPGSFPGKPYLAADAGRVQSWRDRLSRSRAPLNVGISWRGGLDDRARNARSIELAQWRGLLERPGTRFIDLQYGDHAAEVANFEQSGGRPPAAFEDIDALRELDDFAALVSALDLVITVDNSTAHLAGALGVPTFVLLPAGAEWRWGENTASCPWYDSVRLIRQDLDAAGDWTRPLAEVGDALARFEPGESTRGRTATSVGAPQLKAGERNRVVLLNDTRNWYHFGCTCTSLALHDQLRSQHGRVEGVPIQRTLALEGTPNSLAGFDDGPLFDRFARMHSDLISTMERSEAIYINGEGTLHGASPAALSLLYLAHVAATRIGKRVEIINHSCYPGGDPDSEIGALYRRVYEGADRIAIREPGSAALVRDLGLKVTETFDCLPLYVDRLYRPGNTRATPYAVIAGNVAWNEAAAAPLVRLVQHLVGRDIAVRVLIGARAFPAAEELKFADALVRGTDGAAALHVAHNEGAWLDAIAGASLLVSGRFHHTIAAAFLETPFIAANSNTPKIVGLMATLQLDGLLAQPAQWTRATTRTYSRDLRHRADALIDDPTMCLLDTQRRRELMELALRNFAAASTPSSNPAVIAGATA